MGVKKRNDEKLVWEIYRNLTEQCQHLNGLESTYRTLASTWLLAAFAAIGFIMKDAHMGQHASLLIAAVGAAAAAGIFLLWLMDLKVYHQLLAAAFTEQLALEKAHAWLPQVAHKMMAGHDGVGVVPKIVWFYIAPYLLLIVIASIALVRDLGETWNMAGKVSTASACILVFGVGVARYMYSVATKRTTEHVVYRAKAIS